MSKLFYDHLVNIEEIKIVLSEYDISEDDRQQILSTIDETIHHHVLDIIFTHLPREHHEEFLEKLAAQPHHPSLMEFIQQRTDWNIAQEIRNSLQQFLKELIQDIHQSHHDENQ